MCSGLWSHLCAVLLTWGQFSVMSWWAAALSLAAYSPLEGHTLTSWVNNAPVESWTRVSVFPCQSCAPTAKWNIVVSPASALNSVWSLKLNLILTPPSFPLPLTTQFCQKLETHLTSEYKFPLWFSADVFKCQHGVADCLTFLMCLHRDVYLKLVLRA